MAAVNEELDLVLWDIYNEFSKMNWSCGHEAVYGRERFFTEQECKEEEERFGRAMEATLRCLNTYNLEELIINVSALGLLWYLEPLKKFMTADLVQTWFPENRYEGDEDEEEEECKEIYNLQHLYIL